MAHQHHPPQPKGGRQLQGEQRLRLEAVGAAIRLRRELCNWPLCQACRADATGELRARQREPSSPAAGRAGLQGCTAGGSVTKQPGPQMPSTRAAGTCTCPRTKAWPVKGEHRQAAGICQRLLDVPPGEGATPKRVDQHHPRAGCAAAVALRGTIGSAAWLRQGHSLYATVQGSLSHLPCPEQPSRGGGPPASNPTHQRQGQLVVNPEALALHPSAVGIRQLLGRHIPIWLAAAGSATLPLLRL